MILIRSSADLARALEGILDPGLRRLLGLRRDQLTAGADVDLGQLAYFIVACLSDTLAEVEAAAGFPLAGDESSVEWVERHPGGWLEAPVVTDDDGFAVTVIVRDCISTDPALVRALLAHA